MRHGEEHRPINCTLDFHAVLAKALGQLEVAAAGAKWLGSVEVLESEKEWEEKEQVAGTGGQERQW